RSTTPDFCAGVAGAAGVAVGAGAVAPRATGRRAARPRSVAGAGSAALASAFPGPTVRRFTFSSTTVFWRPWLKLCRTTLVSERGLSVSVFVELTLNVLSPPGLLVSVVIPVRSCAFNIHAHHLARPSGSTARKRSRLEQRV